MARMMGRLRKNSLNCEYAILADNSKPRSGFKLKLKDRRVGVNEKIWKGVFLKWKL